MSNFIHDNWLIRNRTGELLFHEVAEKLPILDYHNHINPAQLAANQPFEDLAALWITDDPYKHRAMRICGISEREITGGVSGRVKFDNWVKTLPQTMGNPLYHWTALELKRVFGIDELLSPATADAIWEQCNAMLQNSDFRPVGIVQSYRTELLVTSDDLLDSLEAHRQVKLRGGDPEVIPSLRGDSMLDFGSADFFQWIETLKTQTGIPVSSLAEYLEALKIRLDFFGRNGCVFSDHALDSGFSFKKVSEQEARELFKSMISGAYLDPKNLVKLQSFVLYFLGLEYGRRGWIMQLHIGAQRTTSARLRNLAGAAGGFASIGKACDINSLAQFLNSLEEKSLLPETILYTLNPADNAALASLTGSFTEDGVSGKIQFGPAWWYNDHYAGIKKHLNDISSYGLLGTFIGMTTDSRSILSLSRHEYFRRILCDQIGGWMEEGKLPNDMDLLKQLIKDISYMNIKNKILKREKIWQE